MSTRKVKFQAGAKIEPCPKCGNKTEFTIRSEYCAEDCCEVWAQCKCGHQPDSDDRLEDVWGGCGDDNVQAAMACWNEAMTANAESNGRASDPTRTPGYRAGTNTGEQ